MNMKLGYKGYVVSTVRIPVGGCYGGDYETCVFDPDGNSDIVQRYSNVFLAVLGHLFWYKRVVETVDEIYG